MMESLLNVVIIAKKNTTLRFITTLESIINQEYKGIRIFVVDVNTINSRYSLGIQEDLWDYPDTKYIKLDPSLTMAEIRNHMLEQVEGKYIAFLNANDTWDLSMASFAIRQLEKNPKAVVSCSNGILIDERRPNNISDYLNKEKVNESSKWLVYSPAKMSAQVIYNMKAVRDIGAFDEQFDLLSDTDMLVKLSENNEVLISSKLLCECRITSTFKDYELKLFLEMKKLRIKFMNLLILDKELAQDFYSKIIGLAKSNYMWLDYFIYIIMYFLQAPFATFKMIIKKTGKIICQGITWFFREVSITKEKITIKKNLHEIAKDRRYKTNTIEDELLKDTESFIIPNNVTIIKRAMFYGNKELKSVVIPNTVTEIQAHAFHKCVNLSHVKIQEGGNLSKIGDYAFASCESLTNINLQFNISQIGAYAFAGCFSLKIISFGKTNLFPLSIEKIPRYAFAACRKLELVEFEANSMLENIEDGVFLGCVSLKKILLTGRLKVLGAYSFAYCYNLETAAIIQIDALKTMGKSAFMHCKEMAYFQLPNDIKQIQPRTFYSCSNLKYMKIPKRVLSISYQAFRQCPQLSEVLVLSGDIMISQTAFDRHTNVKIQENEGLL